MNESVSMRVLDTAGTLLKYPQPSQGKNTNKKIPSGFTLWREQPAHLSTSICPPQLPYTQLLPQTLCPTTPFHSTEPLHSWIPASFQFFSDS